MKLIFDGNNLAYRCNVVSELRTKSGERTSAIVGVLNSIPQVARKFRDSDVTIDEIYVIWDGGHNKRRTDLFPEYKANRKKDTSEEHKTFMSEFFQQTNVLHEFLPSLGVKSIKLKGQEADDIIYSLLYYLEKQQEKSIIVSTDEDFLQLVATGVTVYSPIKDIIYTKENFEGLFGIAPESFLSYKVLKGDSSDNIDGIAGIGDKTAKKLVKSYGTLGNILRTSPAERQTLMKSKVTSRIFTKEGLELIQRNNRLINLGYVDATEFEQELTEAIDEQPSIDNETIKAFLMKYQLNSLLAKYREWLMEYKRVYNNYCTG